MKFYFDCGLPRSGSTLLSALLDQNPDIHAGVGSPVFELMYYSDDTLSNGLQAQAFPKPDVFRHIVRSNIINYYSDRDEPIVIDKCRVWSAHIDFLKKYVTDDPKLICIVREPLDILASFITLFNRDTNLPHPDGDKVMSRISTLNSGIPNFIDLGMLRQGLTITDDNRCHYMMNPGGIVWESMNALATEYRQNQKHHIHLIQYDDLVSDPEKVMQGIHWFLKLKPFEYDFNNVVAKDKEIFMRGKDAEVYGLPTMHEVRKEVKKISKPYTEVLSSEVIKEYINCDFWNN